MFLVYHKSETLDLDIEKGANAYLYIFILLKSIDDLGYFGI